MNKRIKKTVYKILEEDEYSRENDNYLIFKVVQELDPKMADSSFVRIINSKISMASITRARRQFFTQNPHLKPRLIAKVREDERKQYAKEFGENKCIKN